MVTIESLGTTLFQQVTQKAKAAQPATLHLDNAPRQVEKQATETVLPGKKEISPAEAKRLREALMAQIAKSPDTDSGSRHVEQQPKQMSLAELAEVLHKVNLTFDIFEVQANFSVDMKTGDVSVQIVNQRTGEVIRRIPPYDLSAIAKVIDQMLAGDKSVDPMLTDVKV